MVDTGRQSNEPETYLKVSEVAKTFGVESATIRDWLKSGKLVGVKIGKGHYWRVPSSSVRKLAEELYGDN